MHHVIVTRVSLTLCLLFGASILGFAWLAGRGAPVAAPPPADAAARQLFETHCGRCHDAAELAAGLRGDLDTEARIRELEAFLADHGRADAQTDRAILDYLASRAGGGGE